MVGFEQMCIIKNAQQNSLYGQIVHDVGKSLVYSYTTDTCFIYFFLLIYTMLGCVSIFLKMHQLRKPNVGLIACVMRK